MTTDFRVERDSMGELKVPAAALWGAQTQRAVNNFPISGMPMPLKDVLNEIVDKFSLDDAQHVKAFEAITNHDVKAVEYFLRDKLDGTERSVAANLVAFLHFASASTRA